MFHVLTLAHAMVIQREGGVRSKKSQRSIQNVCFVEPLGLKQAFGVNPTRIFHWYLAYVE